MSLSPRLVAIQGVGLTPIALAVQGLLEFIAAGGVTQPIAECEISIPKRKWYVRRAKRIHVFDTPDQADAYIAAEEEAQEAVEKAKNTSRLSRKRIRNRIIESVVKPIQTVDVDTLGALVNRLSIPVDIPALMAQQDLERIVQIMAMAMEMQDEEDIEMLLMA